MISYIGDEIRELEASPAASQSVRWQEAEWEVELGLQPGTLIWDAVSYPRQRAPLKTILKQCLMLFGNNIYQSENLGNKSINRKLKPLVISERTDY